MAAFSGSYLAEDVTFLLTEIVLPPTAVEVKERLVQSGERHYSEMIGVESPPTEVYLSLYRAALARNGERLAADIARLAVRIAADHTEGVALLSLARAGTPIGVLLRRALCALGVPVAHYSLSIIRGRGIDARALDHVRGEHPPERWVFVDGWTGKGAITRELRGAVEAYVERRGLPVSPPLAVVSDLAGLAELSATEEDYLIPSALLNAVVSGLVSRTILPRDHDPARCFHRCVYYRELAPHDLSRSFVDALSPLVAAALPLARQRPLLEPRADAGLAGATSKAFLADVMRRFAFSDPNRLKPGLAEATRALLRRVPERLLLLEADADDVRHLVLLAQTKGVPISVDPSMPYRAAVLVSQLVPPVPTR